MGKVGKICYDEQLNNTKLMLQRLVNIAKNKIFLYMISRYIVYFVQFLTTLIIAARLGPYYMGIWGFLLLLINYFAQLHFGIANSLNILLVHHKDNSERDKYIINSLILVFYLSIAVGLFYLYYVLWGIPLFDKYNASKFLVWICIIGILQYVNMVAINIFRVKNMLNHVTFSQSIIIIINFVGVIFLTGELLIDYLIFGYILGNIFIVILSCTSGCFPRLKAVKINADLQCEILKKGILLFFYNSCFYFIILSIKTIVSNYYSVAEFGLFAFSFSLGQAVMLLIGAFSFIVFPKLIDSFSSTNLDEVKRTIYLVRAGYITSAHLIVYTALIVFPLLLVFLPQYQEALTALNLISLTTLLDANSFGFSALLLARNKEKISAQISLFSLLINIMVGIILAKILHVAFSYVIFATMVTYIFFCFSVVRCGAKLIDINEWSYTLKHAFPVKLLFPYLIAVIISLFELSSLIFVPLLVCLLLNIEEVKQIISIINKLLYKPNLIDV